MKIVLLLMFAVFGSISTLTAAPPKLILQITVDQLRGDLPQRFVERMGDGGQRAAFRALGAALPVLSISESLATGVDSAKWARS